MVLETRTRTTMRSRRTDGWTLSPREETSILVMSPVRVRVLVDLPKEPMALTRQVRGARNSSGRKHKLFPVSLRHLFRCQHRRRTHHLSLFLVRELKRTQHQGDKLKPAHRLSSRTLSIIPPGGTEEGAEEMLDQKTSSDTHRMAWPLLRRVVARLLVSVQGPTMTTCSRHNRH